MDIFPDERERTPDPDVIGRVGAGGWSPRGAVRVLIVSERSAWAGRLGAALESCGAACERAGTMHLAHLLMGFPPPEQGDAPAASPIFAAPAGARAENSRGYDAVVCDCAMSDGDGLAFAALASRDGDAGTPVILAAKRASIDLASCAIACGAADLIERRSRVETDVVARILGVAERSRNHAAARSRQTRRLFRLRGATVAINLDTGRQSGPDVTDLLHASPSRKAPPAPLAPGSTDDLGATELAEAMKNVSTVSEFKGLIRGELDIEQLLRTTLEFVLARSGPTNAAVFLPTTSGDYSLGAYVNYDCPKDTCDVLLDHLANAVAPRFENVRTESGMALLTTEGELDEYLGNDADWLRGSHVVGFPCTHDAECLAIFMLFRDGRSPFAGPLLEQVRTVGELFAAQLARVIHIHHRHLPKSKWGMIGDPPAETDDYGDLAA